jgi:hypothetical protein
VHKRIKSETSPMQYQGINRSRKLNMNLDELVISEVIREHYFYD